MATQRDPLERAMALAAVTGLKAAPGPALLCTKQQRPEAPLLVAAALGEMVLDQLGILPDRSRMPLMLPRAAAGAWVARESLKADGIEDPALVAAGAAVAAGTALLAPLARTTGHRLLGVPNFLLGLAENYLALRVGSCAAGLEAEQWPGIARDALVDLRDRVIPDRSADNRPMLGAYI